jgi:hypothetical protein
VKPRGSMFGGVLLVKRGNIGAGQEPLRTAFARVLQNAFSMLFTPFLAEIADALGRDDKAAEGITYSELSREHHRRCT